MAAQLVRRRAQQRKRGDKLPELMRAVKEQFDSKRTLNPGRMVGGV